MAELNKKLKTICTRTIERIEKRTGKQLNKNYKMETKLTRELKVGWK